MVKMALTAMRNIFSDVSDDNSYNEDQSLMAKDEFDSNNEDILVLMANFHSDVENDQTKINYDIKGKDSYLFSNKIGFIF